MCYDDKARPPAPPGQAGAVQAEDIELAGKDGNRFAAYIARSGNPTGAQVLIYPDVRGLHGFYKALADRFAEQGIDALAIDYFGRTAGLTARDESFEYMPHVQQIQLTGFYSDVAAALDYLQSGRNADRPTFIVGFCMGGSLALLTGTEDFKLAGLIAFYSGFTRNFGGERTALEAAHDIRYPVLGLFGGADQGIPVEMVGQLDEQLDKAGIQHDIVIYEGAPHSFFDRKATEFAEASADAWKRILDFISARTGTGANA
ncbi:MAG TPA: dienelactone hydrolase family protein [Chloroflexia bacterium]|nr:dienelactone hydrolase family protein [Chloroflexia bacterium]